MTDLIYKQLLNIVGSENIKVNEPMKKHTSFKVGGNADIMVLPKTENELREILNIANTNNIPFTVIGNGSNLLVKDNGIRGIVIKISNQFKNVTIEGNTITAQAGALLPTLAQLALKNSLTGFETIAGIPGTLGGAIRMNAGAHGGEIKDIVESVTVMDYNGNIKTLSNQEMEFSYRNSILAKENYIVLSCKFKLNQGDPVKIKADMDSFKQRRIDTQPLKYPSAGSTFKRVDNVSVGKILQDLGLKGLYLNGAQISEKHGGFIINNGENTTAQDILNLIDVVKIVVKEKCNLTLEEEVRILGE